MSKFKVPAGQKVSHFGAEVLLKGALIVNAFGVFLPLIFMINSSFRKSSDLFTTPLQIASSFDLTNYKLVFTEGNFVSYFWNSFIVTFSATAIVIVCGSSAAYALARYKFRFNGAIYIFFLAGLLFQTKKPKVEPAVTIEREAIKY